MQAKNFYFEDPVVFVELSLFVTSLTTDQTIPIFENISSIRIEWLYKFLFGYKKKCGGESHNISM